MAPAPHDQTPVDAINADSDRGLAVGGDRPAFTSTDTRGAATIRLGNAASRCSCGNDHAKHGTNAGADGSIDIKKGGRTVADRTSLSEQTTNLPPFQSWHAADGYFRTAHAYMLISRPAGTSTIFGVFQVTMKSP